MKKLITTLTLSIVATACFAQAGAKYATGGNATSTGNILGTTNSQPINFATNNTVKMVLDASGNLRLVNFAGTGNRVILTDVNGKFVALPQGTTNQFLAGNGTWQNLPSGNWLNSGSNLYWTAGSVGVGNAPNAAYKLDVAGDARVQNNLYVGGGILISQKVEATNSLKTDTVHSTTGTTKFTGNIILKQQFQVDGNSLFNGNIQAPTIQTGNLTVNGTTNFNSGIKSTALAGTSSSILYVDSLGNLSRAIPTGGGTPSCNQLLPWFVGGNNLSPSIDNTIGTCTNRDFILKANNSSAIWVKTDGKIGVNTASPNARFEITGNGMTDGIRYNSPNSAGVAFQIATTGASAYSRFLTYGDGRTFIGQFITPANDYDAMGSVLTLGQPITANKAFNIVSNTTPSAPTDLFSVFGNGKTQIGAGQFLSPNKLLTVNGNVLFANNGTSNPAHQYDGYSGFEIVGGDRVPSRRGISVEDDPQGDLSFFINSNQSVGTPQFRFKNGNNTATSASAISDLLVINYNGTTKINVFGAPSTGAIPVVIDAIDVWNVADGKSQFKVKSNGKAYARYMKVTVNGFPDYVFANNYKLASLKEVEAYYKANKHLPEIPAANEVEKDGLDLGMINTLLVKKVEELTIYAVEQNKTAEAQQALLIELQKQIEALKKEVKGK